MNSITQQYYDRLASNLLYLSLAFNLVVMLFAQPNFWEDPALSAPLIRFAFALTGAFLSCQYFCIRQGKLWAKVLLVVSSVAGFLLLALDFHNMVGKMDTLLKAVNNVLGYVSQAVASVLVFRYKFAK